MYLKSEIDKLKLNDTFYENEGDKYCIVNLHQGYKVTSKDIHNHANFCILQLVRAYRENKIESYMFNKILDKIELFVYAEDILEHRQIIDKLNKEIIEEEFHIPYFNSLCILCEDLYDTF